MNNLRKLLDWTRLYHLTNNATKTKYVIFKSHETV